MDMDSLIPVGRADWKSSIIKKVVQFVIFAIFVQTQDVLGTIGCFKCVSVNGNNPACDDPFSHNFSISFYESPCSSGRKQRDGYYPATACIKISGRYHATGETITVRDCALDSGTQTTDTELIRMSHCGSFYLDDRYIKGCIQSCENADGCNTTSRPKTHLIYFITTSILTILFITKSLEHL